LPGAALPDAILETGHLSDHLGQGFTLLTFDPELAKSVGHLPIGTLTLPADSPAAQVLGATARSAFLIRPDSHIAARWSQATPSQIEAAFTKSIGGPRP